jgi:hypothetical protein
MIKKGESQYRFKQDNKLFLAKRYILAERNKLLEQKL